MEKLLKNWAWLSKTWVRSVQKNAISSKKYPIYHILNNGCFTAQSKSQIAAIKIVLTWTK